jgi:hypothetical protein
MTKEASKDIKNEDVTEHVDGEEIEAENTAPVSDDDTPTWFASTYGKQQPDDMAKRYRSQRTPLDTPYLAQHADKEAAYEAYRQRLEERYAMAQRSVEPVYETPVEQVFPTNGQFPQRPMMASAAGMAPMTPVPRRKSAAPARAFGISPGAIAAMTLIACGFGGFGGFVTASPDQAKGIMQSGLAFVGTIWSEPAKLPTETVLDKKPVRAARLEVRDAAGPINSPIPLDIAAYPADGDTPVTLRISGLPEAAYLTKGVEVAQGEWMLKAADIKQAELVVPKTDTPTIALQVSALEEKTGEPAAPAQSLNVALDTNAVPVPGTPLPQALEPRIEPASALPNQQANLPPAVAVPEPLQSLNPEAQGYLNKGNRLLNVGDVLAARQFYLKAFKLDVTAAAFGVGQTYDPAVYAKHNIRGLQPDPQAAAEWYGKAAADGMPEALAAMEQLPTQP